MTLREVYERIDALYPKKISDDYVKTYGGHENSGILLDPGREILGALFSLDLTLAAIGEAKERCKNLIVTHHPAIFYPVSCLKAEDAVLMCARAGISVISAHLNLDSAPGGIDEELMLGLGGSSCSVMHQLSDGGYGRAFEVPEEPLADFAARVKARFCTERIVVYGERPVRKVASFCGAGLDESTVAYALSRGADTVVTADGKLSLIHI